MIVAVAAAVRRRASAVRARIGTDRALARRVGKVARGNPAQMMATPILGTNQKKSQQESPEKSQQEMVTGPRARARRGVEIDVAEAQGVRPAETGRELWRSQVFQ